MKSEFEGTMINKSLDASSVLRIQPNQFVDLSVMENYDSEQAHIWSKYGKKKLYKNLPEKLHHMKNNSDSIAVLAPKLN